MESNEETKTSPNQDQPLEDCGSINTPPEILVDYGTLEPNSNKKTCFIAVGGSPSEEGDVSGFKVTGESLIIVKIASFVPYEDLNKDEIIYCGIVLTWVGFGTVFELDNGSERITSPYLASGTVR